MDWGDALCVAVLLGGCGRADFDAVGSSSRAQEARLDAFATPSSTFVEVPISLTFGSSDQEEAWLVLLSASLRGEDGDIGFRPTTQVRYLIDGVERGLGEGSSANSGSASAWQHFDYVTAPGEHTVRVELRSVSNAEAAVADLHIVALPLSPRADPHFQELTTQVMPVGAYADALVLPLTPPAPGDYLVLVLVVGTEYPSEGVLRARVRDPDGSWWPAGVPLANNQPVWNSMFLARRRALDLAPTAFVLELQGSLTVPSTARDLRMLAFRTDAFASADSVADLEPSSTTSAEPVVKSRLELGSPAERTYLAIQSVMVYDPGQADVFKTRGTRFSAAEGEPLEVRYEVANFDQSMSFGGFRLVETAGPHAYENAFFSPGGAEVVAAESVIHVLALDP